MIHADTIALLHEALDFLNDHPNFGLRRDPQATSYKLAARIDRHLDALAAERVDHVAITLARASLQGLPGVRIDPDETHTLANAEGIWVRAWVRAPSTSLGVGSDPPALADRKAYRAAVMALPNVTREVFLLHRAQGLDYPAIAARLTLTIAEVEQHIADAILHLSTALGSPDDQSR